MVSYEDNEKSFLIIICHNGNKGDVTDKDGENEGTFEMKKEIWFKHNSRAVSSIIGDYILLPSYKIIQL